MTIPRSLVEVRRASQTQEREVLKILQTLETDPGQALGALAEMARAQEQALNLWTQCCRLLVTRAIGVPALEKLLEAKVPPKSSSLGRKLKAKLTQAKNAERRREKAAAKKS